MSKEKIFELENVSRYFNVGGKALKAVDNISLELYKGETFGLVGESGCGKSTLGRVLVRIYKPTGGDVLYKGKNIAKLTRADEKEYTSNVQMIFQDPYASLNPRMTVADIIKEGMRIHKTGTPKEQEEKVYELLQLVGLNKEHAQRFPYEFSGGQRQRIGIARALAVNPEFIVCDEPISALDVSIQAQVINLLKDLQKQLDLTYLFISHDLSMVRYISDRVGVMYLGSLVEVAKSEELYLNPLHPYTSGLLSAIPVPDPHVENGREQELLKGDVPSPMDLHEGCKFAGRCPYATDACRNNTPTLRMITEGHYVACHRAQEIRRQKEVDYML